MAFRLSGAALSGSDLLRSSRYETNPFSSAIMSSGVRGLLNHRLVWKYRSIRNPYIGSNATVTKIWIMDDNPIEDVPDILPIRPQYDNETYLSNRLLAFERDGWRCTKCGNQESLQAHHIEPVPKGAFDPLVVHGVENLQTLCADCHKRLPKM